ncbi:hypothetical protein, partial [Streptomyces brasiliscabiei]|uniref:hypothetical protein n=1 Tax=Streptomyces brasiliscabiei TaxID=2736302 RepID=UPI0030157654
PINLINNLLNLAISRKGEDSVRAHIENYSNNQITLDDCRERFNESHRAVLAKAANKISWFKDIEPAESIARNIIAPNYQSFSPILTNTLS